MKCLWTAALLFGALSTGIVGCREKNSLASLNYEKSQVSPELEIVPVPRPLWLKLISLQILGNESGGGGGGGHAPASPHGGGGEEHAAATKKENSESHGEEKGGHEAAGKEGEAGSGGSQAKDIKETELRPISVFLAEETPGTLGGRHHRIELPAGGGSIDLAHYIRQDRGSFRLGFSFEPDLEDRPRAVWFLSAAKTRKVPGRPGESAGAGCQHYFDVTKAILKASQERGLRIPVANGLHASILGGTFFFSIRDGTLLPVAQVTFMDSRYPELRCPPVAVGGADGDDLGQ